MGWGQREPSPRCQAAVTAAATGAAPASGGIFQGVPGVRKAEILWLSYTDDSICYHHMPTHESHSPDLQASQALPVTWGKRNITKGKKNNHHLGKEINFIEKKNYISLVHHENTESCIIFIRRG